MKWVKIATWISCPTQNLKGQWFKKNQKFTEIFFVSKDSNTTLQDKQKSPYKKLHVFKIEEAVCTKVSQALIDEFYPNLPKPK